MNRDTLRRFIIVALPCAVIAAVAATAALTAGTSGEEQANGVEGAPAIGQHWHAVYQVVVCGEPQPNFPIWEGGVHTHADGIIHIHPFQDFEEGPGARLVKFFEYGGGLLTPDEMRMPGSADTFRNGDRCPDGSPGVLGISVNDEALEDWMEYIPADGDRVLITFGGGGR